MQPAGYFFIIQLSNSRVLMKYLQMLAEEVDPEML